jgi:methionyl-tRNA formyltransferase
MQESLPDKPVGRHKELLFTPVKEVAIKNNIPVFQPIKIKEDYENVIEIKRRIANGESDSIISKDYNVNRQTINKIRLKQLWNHITS